MSATPKVEVRRVSITFKTDRSVTRALSDVDLAVEDGEFVVLIGPSGCGKSTLLYAIGGFVRPDSGEIRIDGKIAIGPGADRGIVFQQFALYPWLSVAKNIALGLELRGVSPKQRNEIVNRWLATTGLTAFRNHFPRQLSGGMQQRVAIARALAAKPEVVLMDEPFGALDAQTKRHMIADLQRIWSTSATSIVFVTHSVDEAIFLGDRILVMTPHPGRIKAEYRVEIPRPRNDTDLAFVALKRTLLDALEGPSGAAGEAPGVRHQGFSPLSHTKESMK